MHNSINRNHQVYGGCDFLSKKIINKITCSVIDDLIPGFKEKPSNNYKYSNNSCFVKINRNQQIIRIWLN